MKHSIEQTRTIVMVTNNYFPYQTGVAQSVHASTQALMAQGYKVIIITLDVLPLHNDPPYVIRVPSLIRTQCKNNPIGVPLRATAFLKKLILQIRPDVIHTHHPWLLGSAALQAASVFQCPIVFTHHTMYEAYTHYVPLPKRITSFFIRTRLRSYCHAVDHIIAPSTAVANAIATYTTSTEISVIPSPIRPSFFAPCKKLTTDKKPISLLYVGRFVPEKNIPALLDAIALLPAQSYTLACVGSGYLWHELQQYAYATLQLDPAWVQFHPQANEERLVSWYRQADLFLFSSVTDTQGLVLAEAMACGTPVIAFDGPGQRSIIAHGYNGYIVAHSSEMAQKIVFMMQNREQLAQLSIGARKTATGYTHNAHAQQLTTLYETVITQRGSSTA